MTSENMHSGEMRLSKERKMTGKHIRKMAVILFVCGVTLGLTIEALAAGRRYVSLGTGNPGGTFYFIGAGFASIFNKYIPGVRVIAESTAASEENFHYIMRKKMDLGLVSISVVQTAVEKNWDMGGIRLMAIGHSSDRHWFVRKESSIKSLSDFRGHRIAVGSPGSGTLMTSRRCLEAACGLTFDDFKPAYLSFTESITAIKDGTVDVGTIAAGYPIAGLLDLARQTPIRLISYTEKEVEAVITKYPFYVRIVIPAGTYIGIDTDTVGEGGPTALFCRKDLNEDLAYELMKALYDHPKEKEAIHPQAKQWNLENIFRGADFTTKNIPFHPGAVKYLKEKALWKERD